MKLPRNMSDYQERIAKAYEYLSWSLERYNEEIAKLEKRWFDNPNGFSEKNIEWLAYLKIMRSKKYE